MHKPYLCFLLLVLLTGIPVFAQEPEEALQSALAKLEAAIPEAMSQTGTPGVAVAVVSHGRVVYQRGFGVRRKGNNAPITPQTVFQIGSISKSFTAFLMGSLVDEGSVKWEQRVVDHLPEFRLSDPWVTREFRLFDLMSQHSGLPATAGDLQILCGVDADQVRQSLRYFQPASSFRTEFAYQNGLFLVAAELLEKTTGRTWNQLLEQRIFAPLRLKHTSSTYAAYTKETDRAAFHQYQNGEVAALPDDWPYFDYVDLLGPAGGINSSAEDMAQYLLLRLEEDNTKLLSAENAHYLQRPQTVMRTGMYYCQGLIHQDTPMGTIIWHNGETSGAKNMMAFQPDKELGIVVLSNLRGNNLPEQIAIGFLQACAGGEFKVQASGEKRMEMPPRPKEALPARSFEVYGGEFHNPVYGKAVVSSTSQGPVLQFGDQPHRYPLKSWDGDTFWLELPLIDQPADGFCHFTFTSQGKVSTLTVEAMDQGRAGTFRVAP